MCRTLRLANPAPDSKIMKNPCKNCNRKPGWLWRLVRHLVRFFTLYCIVAVHHVWFDVGHRGWLLTFVDGGVLLGLGYLAAWLIKDSPNRKDEGAGIKPANTD